jgi:hypothetical protein
MPKRRDEDPTTHLQWLILDGVKLQIVNKQNIIFKHGAMGTYQRQFDTVFLESKLVQEIMQLKEGEELAAYEDEEHAVEKLLEDENFLQ